MCAGLCWREAAGKPCVVLPGLVWLSADRTVPARCDHISGAPSSVRKKHRYD